MERDTIAQRISALRKEVFLVPPSPVSDPQRKLVIPTVCIPGGSALGVQSPSVPTLNPRRSLPAGSSDMPPDTLPPKRMHSISPRPNGGQPSGSSPANRESPDSSSPLHSHRRASSGGCSPASSEASHSPSQSVPPLGGSFGDRPSEAPRDLPAQKRTPRSSGPVRADVRVDVPKPMRSSKPAIQTISPSALATPVGAIRRRAAPVDVLPGRVLSINTLVVTATAAQNVPAPGDVGGSPDEESVRITAQSVVVEQAPLLPTRELPPLGGDDVPRTVSAVPTVVAHLRASDDNTTTRSQSAPLSATLPPMDLDGPRLPDMTSPRARQRQSLAVNTAAPVATSADDSATISRPASSKRRPSLSVTLNTLGASDGLPLKTPIVGLAATVAPQPSPTSVYAPVRPTSDVLFTLSPRRFGAIRTPTAAAMGAAAPPSDVPIPVIGSSPDESVPRQPSPATHSVPLPPDRRVATSQGFSGTSPLFNSRKLTPKASPTAAASVATITTTTPSVSVPAPPSKPLSVKRGAFAFDDDDILASDLAHGVAPVAGVGSETPTIAVCTPPTPAKVSAAPPVALSTPGGKRKPPTPLSAAVSVSEAPTVPAPPKSTPKFAVSVPAVFTPFPSGCQFDDVDIDLNTVLPKVEAPSAPSLRQHRRRSPPPLEARPRSAGRLSPDADVMSGSRRSRRRPKRTSGSSRPRLPDALKRFEPAKISSGLLDAMIRAGRESWREYRDAVKTVRGECDFMGALHEDKVENRGAKSRTSVPPESRARWLGIARSNSSSQPDGDDDVASEVAVVDDFNRIIAKDWKQKPQGDFIRQCAEAAAAVDAGVASAKDAASSRPRRNSKKLAVSIGTAGVGDARYLLTSPMAITVPSAPVSSAGKKRPPALAGLKVAVEAADAVKDGGMALLASPVASSKYSSTLSRSGSSSAQLAVSSSTSTLRNMFDSPSAASSGAPASIVKSESLDKQSRKSVSSSRHSESERRSKRRSHHHRHHRRHRRSSSRHRRRHHRHRSPSSTDSYSSYSDTSSSPSSASSDEGLHMSSDEYSDWSDDASEHSVFSDGSRSSDSAGDRRRHHRHKHRRHKKSSSHSRRHRERR